MADHRTVEEARDTFSFDRGPGDGPASAPHRTVGVAPYGKNSFQNGPEQRICAREDCSEFVVASPGGSPKRYCSERCRRIAERRRYRTRRVELATCKRDGCGVVFERTATSERRQVFCSLECQALARSLEYRARADILAGVVRARNARGAA